MSAEIQPPQRKRRNRSPALSRPATKHLYDCRAHPNTGFGARF